MSSGTSAIENVSLFGLTENSVFLGEKSELHVIGAGSSGWRDIVCGRDQDGGRMFAVYSAQTDRDVHSAQWEMHSAGDELVGVFSGHLSLILKDLSGTRRIHLTTMTAAIVPAGIWHRFQVITPALLFAVTPRAGTQLQDVTDV